MENYRSAISDEDLKKTKSYTLVSKQMGEARTLDWFRTPNPAFGKRSPADLIQKAEGDKVYSHLCSILDGK